MGSTFHGTPVVPVESAEEQESKFAQLFCCTDDLVNDMESPGGDVVNLYKAIRDASDYLQKEIGWFIPVTETIKMRGSGNPLLRVPPILSISSIINDDDILSTSDYFLIGLDVNQPFWPNGPYVQIEVDPDSTVLAAWYDAEPDSVQITAKRGLYEHSAALSATVADTTQQSASQTTLKVSDGSKVSPGMVLLIGSEQESVTGWGSPTASVTALNGAITADTEVLTVDNGALLYAGETIRVEFEQMRVREIQTNSVLVWRGWNRTARVSHADDKTIDVYRTVNVERGVNGTTAAIHVNGTAISRYLAPDDIQYLTRQIATLMINKAKSGYAGKTGNEQTGTVFYNDAFPRFEIERVKANYALP